MADPSVPQDVLMSKHYQPHPNHRRSARRMSARFRGLLEYNRHLRKLDEAAAGEQLRLTIARQRMQAAEAAMPQVLKDELEALYNLKRELTAEEWHRAVELQHMKDGTSSE